MFSLETACGLLVAGHARTVDGGLVIEETMEDFIAVGGLVVVRDNFVDGCVVGVDSRKAIVVDLPNLSRDFVAIIVDENGVVVDAVVVESTPSGVFDRAALAAIETWRYEAADSRTEGHTYSLDFRLGE